MPTETEKPVRHVGTVRFFDDGRGFGFIATALDSPLQRDIFVHHTCILMDGYRTLHKDQTVEFYIEEDPKDPNRPIARKVVVI